ncbi:MAG: hypothetical protein KDA32_08980, partial [Phycisphaerales bacterium]|nr:hypothetical protein [Phycisphaerales bacterium]
LPAAIVAVLTTAVAVMQLRPPERQVDFPVVQAKLQRLMDSEAYVDAADAATNLLAMKPPLPEDQQAALHDLIAEVVYRQEMRAEKPSRRNAEVLVAHSEQLAATRQGPSSARAALRLAAAQEWLGRLESAEDNYRVVLDRQPGAEDRRTALQALVRLLEGREEAEIERRGYLRALLTEPSVDDAYVWWALQHAVQEALDRDAPEEAAQTLEEFGSRFKQDQLRGYYDYLRALTLIESGRYLEAEPLLASNMEWLAAGARGDDAMDAAGYLPAMNEWLAARVELLDGRPQTALLRFTDTLNLAAQGPLMGWCSIGQAEALAALERDGTARTTLREALARLDYDPALRQVFSTRMRRVCEALFSDRLQARRLSEAIAYVELALELTRESDTSTRLALLERLGETNALAASMEPDVDQARALHLAAGRAFEAAAPLAYDQDTRLGALLWSAAEEYDAAGQLDAVRRILTRYVDERSLDPRIPLAMLRLGEAYAADAYFEDAILWYERLDQEFGRLDEAIMGRYEMAQALLSLGGDENETRAVQQLDHLLHASAVDPSAPIYRDGMLLLADIHEQAGRYADAIGLLEEFLRLYAGDPEAAGALFKLADSYRRSAYALRSAPEAPTPERRTAIDERFHRAADLFQTWLERSSVGGAPTPSIELYQRLALLNRGDCFFELNTAASLEEALAIYRQAAAQYQGEPAALSAQVQIANVFLRLGRVTEAARAVERARALLSTIPDQAFAQNPESADRTYWDRYLATVASSHLFKDVFAAP